MLLGIVVVAVIAGTLISVAASQVLRKRASLTVSRMQTPQAEGILGDGQPRAPPLPPQGAPLPRCCCVGATAVNLTDGVCWPPPEAAGGRRFRMLFWSNELGPHGTEVAMYDYATHFEDALGGTAYIGAYADGSRGMQYPDAMGARAHFESRFPGRVHVLSDGAAALDAALAEIGADALYTIQAGCDDMPISPAFRPMLVHAVFYGRPAVERCAAVSAGANVAPGVPIVHHMAYLDPRFEDAPPLPLPNGTERVFCRHGGKVSFNIDNIHDSLREHVKAHPHDVFLFMNTQEDPGDAAFPHNFVYLNFTADLRLKRRFLNSCSACIHARVEGETFGLSLAECSLAGLPVITSSSFGGFHLGVLGEHGLTYADEWELARRLGAFDAGAHRAKAAVYRGLYARFAPELVMREFVDGFRLLPALRAAANPHGLPWRGRCEPPPGMERWLPRDEVAGTR